MKQEIGKRIEILREDCKMTREELAEKAGVSTKFLYEIEKGKKGLSALTLLKLARVLNTSCDYILTGDKGITERNSCFIEVWNQLDDKKKNTIVKIINLIIELGGKE